MTANFTPEKQRILLVDDEPQILVALEDLLSDQFVVLTAASAERALDVMAQQPNIAVVVTDQRMPKMAGDELVARMNTIYTTQRIMVTGYADLTAVVRAVNEGRIFAYVTKPWDEDDLRLKVRKAAEQFRLSQELAAERQLLHDLMDNSPDGIYFKDTALSFIKVNASYARWVNRNVQQVVGTKLTDFVGVVERAAEIEAEERQVLDDGRPLLDVVRQFQSNDESRWLSETKAPIRDNAGKVVGLVGISRDVTEQRQLEQQLLHAQKMEAVGRLAGGVAHDFNNLLAVIQSYAQLVLRNLPADDRSRSDLGELLEATNRAASLTKQLLTFSRKQPMKTTMLDLNQIVTDVEKMIRRLVDESVQVTTKLGSELESIRGDVTQLEQVILNLAINARDAMPDGGRLVLSTKQLELPSEGDVKGGPYLLLSVRDTGTGMTPEVQKRVFEPFFTTKEAGKGTGLGLSTVYGVVQQSGGHVRVHSELGKGTCFEIYFPVLEDAKPRATPKPSQVSSGTGSETILLVEDDEAVRRVAARILREHGYTVIEAGTPLEALRLVTTSTTPIDLLLTDIVMPEMNGHKLARELTATRPEIRVLFMSGYAEGVSNTQELSEFGAGYIEKPFTPAGLAAEVRAALSDRAEANTN